jgi:hypothetical protein
VDQLENEATQYFTPVATLELSFFLQALAQTTQAYMSNQEE